LSLSVSDSPALPPLNVSTPLLNDWLQLSMARCSSGSSESGTGRRPRREHGPHRAARPTGARKRRADESVDMDSSFQTP
jgi:hypothetical protein